MLAAIAAICACGGGDGPLSAEEYFRRMDEIDKDLDRKSEEIFGDGDVSAREGADRFVAIADGAKKQYQDMDPPDDLKDTHDAVIEAIDEFADAMDSAADAAPNEAELTDLFQDPELSAADQELAGSLCALQPEADKRGIQADVGCDSPQQGSPANPATPPAQSPEATE